MSIGQQILFFISALGAFNGILLSFYLFLSRKNRSIATLFLGVMLLSISVRVAKSVLLYFNPGVPKLCLQVGLSACFLIGPSLYFFFRSALEKPKSMPVAWEWTWAVLLGTLLIGGAIVPYQTYPDAWNHVIVYIIYGQWFLFMLASGWVLKNIIRNFFTNRASLKLVEKFLLWVFVGNSIIFTVYTMSLYGVVRGMYISGGVCFSFILYLTVFFYMHGGKMKQVLQEEKPTQEDEATSRTEKKRIADTDAALWAQKLETVIREQALHKDANLKLNDLAKKINIPAHQLSQLLNDNLGKSFSTYINEYRIEEACKLIETNDRLTLEAIGYEVGFNSKSTFYTAFRKIKDTTPALFKESLAKS